jgi:hypothetical protein
VGSFLFSVHIPSKDQVSIRSAVEAYCSASVMNVWLGSTTGRWTSLFPEDLSRSATLGQQLSAQLDVPVLFTLVHDSDAFCCLLFEHRNATEEFVSRPDLMGGPPSAAQVPERIVALAGKLDITKVSAIAGIFIEGTVVSSRARAFPPKDGKSASISVKHEIALNPGLATIEEYFDVEKDIGIKMKDGEVLEFPRLKQFSWARVRAESFKVFNNKIVFRGITILTPL